MGESAPEIEEIFDTTLPAKVGIVAKVQRMLLSSDLIVAGTRA
jgi:hypothetical protein